MKEDIPWVDRRLFDNAKMVRKLKQKQALGSDKSKFVTTINNLLRESKGLEEVLDYCLEKDIPLEAHRWQQITTWLKHEVPFSMIAKAIGEPESVVKIYSKINKEVGGYSYLDDERTMNTTWIRDCHLVLNRNTDSSGYYEGRFGS